MVYATMSTDQMVHRLEDHLLMAHVHWLIYKQLYTRRQDKEILRKFLGDFSGILRRLLVDDVFLRIARMTDPPESGNSNKGYKNLAFRSVIEQVEQNYGKQRMKWIKARMHRVNRDAEELRRHRNKRLAHSDLDTIAGITTTPLMTVPRHIIDRLFDDLEAIIQHLDCKVGRSSFRFSSLVLTGDGRLLLLQLYRTEGLFKFARHNNTAYEILRSINYQGPKSSEISKRNNSEKKDRSLPRGFYPKQTRKRGSQSQCG